MEVPPSESSPDSAAVTEAVELFTERARASDPDFELDASNLEAVVALCQRLDGIPLAIELAAARIPAVTPGQLNAQLDDRFEILTEGARTALPRHRTLKAAIEWSYQLLTEQEMRMFDRLGVAVGSFDLDAAVAIGSYDQATTLNLVNQLVAKSMLTIEASTDRPRYRLLESLRRYALDNLDRNESEGENTRGRHAHHYARLLDELEDKHQFPTEDLDNLRGATDWMIRHAPTRRLVEHLKNIWPVYRLHTWYAEATTIFEQATNRPDLNLHDEAWLRIRIANSYQQQGQSDQAEDHLRQGMKQLDRRIPTSGVGWSLRLVRELLKHLTQRVTGAPGGSRHPSKRESARLRAEALVELTTVFYVTQRELPASVVGFWQLSESELSRDLLLSAGAHTAMGLGYGIGGLHRLAGSYVRRSTELVERTDPSENPAHRALLHMTAGLYWLSVGAWSQSMSQAETAMSISHSYDAWVEDGSALIHALASHLTGESARGFKEALQVHQRSRERGSFATELWGLLIVTEIAMAHDQAHLAQPWLDRAAEVVDRVNQPGDIARRYVLQARILGSRGADEREILDLVKEASRMVADGPPRQPYELETSAGLAEVPLDLLESGADSQTEALELVRTGTKTLHSFSRSAPIAKPRHSLVRGRVALHQSRTRAAIRLFERSARTAEEMGMPLEEAKAHERLAKAHTDPTQQRYHSKRLNAIREQVLPPSL